MVSVSIIFYTLGAVLMILGGVELVRMLAFWLNRSSGPGKGAMTLVVCPQDPESCEALVLAALTRVRWMDLRPPCRLVCLYVPQTQPILERLAETYREVELLAPEELEAELRPRPLI